MADEKPTKVTVEALKYHTNAGAEYQVGDTYDVDESAVDNLVHQGMAVRVDRVAHAKAQEKAAATSAAKPAKPAKSTKVEPMTLSDKAVRPSQGARPPRAPKASAGKKSRR